MPRTALLNQFAEVTPEGRYLSPIDNPNKRFFTMLGTLVQGRVCVGGAGINAAKVALAIATALLRAPPPVRGDLARRGAGAPRLRHAPAPAAAAPRADVRPPLRAGGRRRPAARRLLRPRPDRGGRRRARPPDAGVPRRRHQGARHLARHPHHPGVPRGLRRRGLPQREPVHRAQGRHRRLHHLRGRQPRPAAARRQGPAHRLRRRVRGHGPARHGPLRRRPRGRDRRRAHRRCTSSCSRCATCCPAATAGTRRPACSTPTTSSPCCASARST